MMTDEEEKHLIEKFTTDGWRVYENSATTLSFIYEESDEYHWMRDYYKEERRFIHYNAKQKVNLVTTKEFI